MAHKFQDELEAISDYYEGGKRLAAQLDQPELAAVRMKLLKFSKEGQLFIQSLLGNAREPHPSEVLHIQPLTHIFGVEIKPTNKPVTAGDTNPTNSEKEKFIAEVDDYYKNFPKLAIEKLFNKSTIPGGDIIIRAVAKKAGFGNVAGFENYDTMPIDELYLNALKLAVEKKHSEQTELQESKDKIVNALT